MSQAGLVNIEGSHPQIATQFDTDSGPAVPLANVLEVLGGAGVSTSGSGNTITITVTSGTFTWNVVTAATQALVVENGYIGNRGTTITYTLPTTAAVGDRIMITNIGAGLPVIAQNAGESINFTASTTTVGVGGSLTAVDQFVSLELVCVVADTDWNILDSIGNWTII